MTASPPNRGPNLPPPFTGSRLIAAIATIALFSLFGTYLFALVQVFPQAWAACDSAFQSVRNFAFYAATIRTAHSSVANDFGSVLINPSLHLAGLTCCVAIDNRSAFWFAWPTVISALSLAVTAALFVAALDSPFMDVVSSWPLFLVNVLVSFLCTLIAKLFW